MKYDDACERLLNHANLPNSGTEVDSLGFALWQVSEGDDSCNKIDMLFNDVINCLVVVNIEVNGDPPSSVPNPKKGSVDRWVSYSFTCLLELVVEAIRSTGDTPKRESLLAMLADLVLGWNCVLAGDIDDIRFEIETTRRSFLKAPPKI